MLDLLKAKIESYATQIENAVSNTDFLNTVKTELENVYNEFLSAEPVADEILEVIDPTAAIELETVTTTVESVVNAVE